MSEEDKHTSLVKAVVQLVASLATWLKEITDIAALELQVAGKSLLLVLCLYCAIGFLLLFAWIFALAAIAAALVVFLKLTWFMALLCVALFNLAAIVPILLLIVKYKRHLTFPETRKQLQLNGGKYEDT